MQSNQNKARKADENFDSGIVKTIELYLGKYFEMQINK